MTTPQLTVHPTSSGRTPSDLLLTGSLLVAPPLYLLADGLYTVRGWDDGDAGGVHVIAAIAYGFVLLRFASWGRGRLGAAMLVAAVIGTAGNVAYGFNTIHVSLGAVDLVDTTGPGAIIKPLGLAFPVALLLGAAILRAAAATWSAALLAVSALVWPVAHIGNVGWLAVGVNVVLVTALLPLARTRPPASPSDPLGRPDRGVPTRAGPGGNPRR